jgi:hypothetical protein
VAAFLIFLDRELGAVLDHFEDRRRLSFARAAHYPGRILRTAMCSSDTRRYYKVGNQRVQTLIAPSRASGLGGSR